MNTWKTPWKFCGNVVGDVRFFATGIRLNVWYALRRDQTCRICTYGEVKEDVRLDSRLGNVFSRPWHQSSTRGTKDFFLVILTTFQEYRRDPATRPMEFCWFKHYSHLVCSFVNNYKRQRVINAQDMFFENMFFEDIKQDQNKHS